MSGPHHVESFYDGRTNSHGWQCFTCGEEHTGEPSWAMADVKAEIHRQTDPVATP